MNHIPASTWAEIRTAYASGIGLRELARNMGISAGTVLARSKREGWTQQIQNAKALRVASPNAITPMQSAAISTQERKAELLTKSLRIAAKAGDRVEETISQAGCSQAAVVYGITIEKALLLAGEPTQIVQVNLAAEDIYSELRLIQAEIIESLRSELPQLRAIEAEVVTSAVVAGD